MTNEQICTRKPYYNCQDIMQLMNCSRCKAYEYIRIIKSMSDRSKTAGIVMVADFNIWAYGVGETQEEKGVRSNEFVRVVPFKRRFY